MECYKNFAEIYDELINTDIDYNEWAKSIKRICDKNNIAFDDYLDLGCGTANMTKAIASLCRFKNIWAVDMSSDMLTKADVKLRNSGIKAKLLCEDITSLNLNHKFDLVTCCLDCTNYILEEDGIEDYFNGVYDSMKENSIFIFDMNSYYKISNVLCNNVYNYDSDDIVYIWDNSFEGNIVDMYISFFVKENELYRRFDEVHTERAYKDEHIEKLLQKCKFNVIGKLDNYTEDKINPLTERIVYIVKK